MDLLEHCTWRAKPGEVRTEQASQNNCGRGQATLLGGCKHRSFTSLGLQGLCGWIENNCSMKKSQKKIRVLITIGLFKVLK